jgi:hypothetical protein
MDKKTYCLSVAGVTDAALLPISSFKELLINLDEKGLTVDPIGVGVVLESLLETAERKINEMQSPLNAQFGRVFFQIATTAYPDAEPGAIVGLEVVHG